MECRGRRLTNRLTCSQEPRVFFNTSHLNKTKECSGHVFEHRASPLTMCEVRGIHASAPVPSIMSPHLPANVTDLTRGIHCYWRKASRLDSRTPWPSRPSAMSPQPARNPSSRLSRAQWLILIVEWCLQTPFPSRVWSIADPPGY